MDYTGGKITDAIAPVLTRCCGLDLSKFPPMTSELLLSKLPVTRRVLFLIFFVFSLRNTLFLVNYTTYPWIGSGIFRLAAFCNLKKESVAAGSHTFSLSLSSRACWSPCFRWAEHLCWSFFFFLSPQPEVWRFLWHEWKFVQTPVAGVLFGRVEALQAKLGLWFVSVVTGSGSPEVSWVLQLFWFRSAENPKPKLSNPCVSLNKWVQEEITSPVFSSLGSLISWVIPGTAALQRGWHREFLGYAFAPLSSRPRQKVPLNGIILLFLTSVSGKESWTPFLKRRKVVKGGWGKAPCLTEMCPKLCLKTCCLLYAKSSRELSQQKGRGYLGEISISKASPQFSSK